MRKCIGVVGVDSGQIIIMDPCYIDDNWETEEFDDTRIYRHKATGDILKYPHDFKNYEDKFYAGKNMNQMIADKEIDTLESPQAECNLSYNAVCRKTLDKDGYGQINYLRGHPGLAVAARSGHGDGLYDVWGTFDENGTIIKLEIDF